MSTESRNPGFDRRSLEAVQALMRALGHRVRTPLSIVSNELTYLTKVYETEECRRAMERCQGISRILKSATLSHDPEIQEGDIPLQEFIEQCLQQGIPAGHGVSANLFVRANAAEVKEATSRINEMLAEVATEKAAGWRMQIDADDSRFLLECEMAMQCAPRPGGQVARFSSFSSCFCTACGLDLISAPLADALLWANGASVEIVYDGKCRVQIAFPLNKAG